MSCLSSLAAFFRVDRTNRVTTIVTIIRATASIILRSRGDMHSEHLCPDPEENPREQTEHRIPSYPSAHFSGFGCPSHADERRQVWNKVLFGDDRQNPGFAMMLDPPKHSAP